MGQIRFKLDRRAFRTVARSPEVRLELGRRARLAAAQARRDPGRPPDEEVHVSTFTGRNRARASVMAPSGLASDQANRWLGRSIDAARG